VDSDAEADRIRGLVMLRATCETVLKRLDEDDLDDLALTVQIGELCDTLSDELARFAHRHEAASPRADGSPNDGGPPAAAS
jgi:hypothetical protein